jgi:predicted lipoprotein with Yx(FWY)xxD motif
MKKLSFLPLSLLALSLAAGAADAPSGIKTKDGVLTNSAGMTLYTFDKDSGGKSACNDKCAANWPPVMAAEGDKTSGDYSVITRDDGKKQWAYKGKPLYTWVKDSKPGDKTGDGFNNGVWHAAKP